MNWIALEVESQDNSILSRLFGELTPSHGSMVEVPGNANIRYEGTKTTEGIWPGAPEVLQLSLGFGTGVVASLVATWLVDKLKDRGNNNDTCVRLINGKPPRIVEMTVTVIIKEIDEVTLSRSE